MPLRPPLEGVTIDPARGLAPAQLHAIFDLERRVVAHDGGRLKLEPGVLRARPAGEVHDFLAWDGRTLVGFCGVYGLGSDPELAGAVDPAYRRRGIGSALLGQALALLATRHRLRTLLVTPRSTATGRMFAHRHGATLDHSEHHLELDGAPAGPTVARPATVGDRVRVRVIADGDRARVAAILAAAFGEQAVPVAPASPTDVPFVVERDGAVVGTMRLCVADGSAGVYGFAVHPALRNQGIGRTALFEVCLEARRRGARTVTLEVDVDNDRALGLYTSVGFERRTTEDYFALAVDGE